jgi:hypothetical protein
VTGPVAVPSDQRRTRGRSRCPRITRPQYRRDGLRYASETTNAELGSDRAASTAPTARGGRHVDAVCSSRRPAATAAKCRGSTRFAREPAAAMALDISPRHSRELQKHRPPTRSTAARHSPTILGRHRAHFATTRRVVPIVLQLGYAAEYIHRPSIPGQMSRIGSPGYVSRRRSSLERTVVSFV